MKKNHGALGRLLMLSSFFFSGCYYAPSAPYHADFSDIIGKHVLNDICFDVSYGLYEKNGDWKPKDVCLVIGFIPSGSDFITPLHTVEHSIEEDCAWYYSGGCSSEVRYDKTVSVSLNDVSFRGKNGSFRIAFMIFDTEQDEHEKSMVSESSGGVFWNFDYSIEEEIIAIKRG